MFVKVVAETYLPSSSVRRLVPFDYMLYVCLEPLIRMNTLRILHKPLQFSHHEIP